MTQQRLPYFDYLLSELGRQNPAIEKSFGRHVHWGYWDDPENALGDDEDFARAAEKLTLELCQLAEIAEGQQVLDVGCGFGGTVASLNERFGALQLTGLNIDARQLARARQLVQPLRSNTVKFCEGDACNLPFAAESFDRVLAVECIFHFPSRETFFKEAFRVLKPGGSLALSDFVPAPLFLPMTWLLAADWFEKFNVCGHCDMRCTAGQYRRLAAQTGFVPVLERDVTKNTLPTYDYLQRIGALNVTGGHTAKLSGPLIRMQRMLSALGLLNYHLLLFRKP